MEIHDKDRGSDSGKETIVIYVDGVTVEAPADCIYIPVFDLNKNADDGLRGATNQTARQSISIDEELSSEIKGV